MNHQEPQPCQTNRQSEVCDRLMPPETGIVVVGHGTADPVGAAETADTVAQVAAILPNVPVELGYLEVIEPTIAMAVERLADRGCKKIIAIPNVKLIHPSVNSQELISKSTAVALISGGTGFEALFHKKPVILFSDEIYQELSTVTKVSTFDKLFENISEAIKNFKFNIKEINALMTVIENQSISVPYFSMIKDGVTLSAIQRNEQNVELTLKQFKKFHEKYEDSFKQYAEAVYLKF